MVPQYDANLGIDGPAAVWRVPFALDDPQFAFTRVAPQIS
jgi:hypothetical protein